MQAADEVAKMQKELAEKTVVVDAKSKECEVNPKPGLLLASYQLLS